VTGYRFWTYPPIGWIAYLPLLVVFAAPLAAILGAGSMLGAPSLIWHDQTGTKIWAGFALAVLYAELGIVGYLLDSRENPNQTVAPDAATVGSLARYLMWPLLVLLGVTVRGYFERRATTPDASLVLIGPAVVVAGVLWLRFCGLRKARLFDLVPVRHQRRAKELVAKGHRHAPERSATAPDPGAHAVQFVVLAVLVVAYVVVWRLDRHVQVPAAVAVSLSLSLAMGVWGLLRFWFRRWRLFWSAVLIVLACSIGVTGDRPVTGLSHVSFPENDVNSPKNRANCPENQGNAPKSQAKVPGNGTVAPKNRSQLRELLDDAVTLDAWKKELGEPLPPLVVVATSGGALRAGLWTVNVLGALERRRPGFLRHVRLVTGASGGMVGAGFLVSALDERKGSKAALAPEWFSQVEEELAKDSLTPITSALILPRMDRGTALENVWEKNAPRLARPFRDLLAGEKAGWLPSLVYAPMLVEDGRRLFVSNLDLDALARTMAPLASCCDESCQESLSAVQLFACTGDGIDGIKLSTVARLNATFPWVTSAALLTTKKDRRVVDAGYYDNYGVDIATAWIRKNAAWLQQNTSGVMLIQIRDDVSQKPELDSAEGPSFIHEWYSALSTPIEGFFNAWDASMSFRNDQKIEVLADNPHLDSRADGRKHFFSTQLFSFEDTSPEKDKVPLEWYLDRAAIEKLKKPPSEEAINRVLGWWPAPAPSAAP
jgi:hypothetical protein